MSLASGRRIGSYEIVSRLGSGGMGDVYRARDLRLGRDVAIKILPPAFISDADRLLRFEREARILAALNHPHIATIYGIEQVDDIRAIVLELVDGETLADRIARGPLAPNAAIAIARQIAEALDVAHEKGIIHRDLKPGNVALTRDGIVKVLDFGLATAPSSPSAELTHSPTISIAGTAAGVILGTAAYMSPEQTRGQVVDKRTDVWAFGCVLYEMLTGHSAYGRGTVSDTIAAILERDPDWRRLEGTPGLLRIVRHCLEKDARARARDIADVRFSLAHALDAIPAASRRSSRVRIALSIAAIVLATWGGDLLVRSWLATTSDPATSGARTALALTRVTADEGVTADPAISRDGTLIAFATDRAGREDLDIWIQRASGGLPIRLTDEAIDEHEPAISPDGSLIAFRSEREGGGIYVMPALGGEQPRLLVAGGRRPRFSPDGTAIAFWTGSNIGFTERPKAYRTFVVRRSGGTPTEIGPEMTGVRYPVWSPDGKGILATATRADPATLSTFDWWWFPIGGGPAVEVGIRGVFRDAGIDIATTAIWPEAWTESRVLFSDFQSIWSVGIDLAGRLIRPLERLTFGTSRDAQPSAAATGVIAFTSFSQSNHVWALPLDADRGIATGPPKRLTVGVGTETRPSASSDGLQLLYRSLTQTPTIHLRNLVSGRVTDAGVSGSGFGPALSPDGRWIAFESNSGVSLMPSLGGPVRVLCTDCSIGDWIASSAGLLVITRNAFSLVDVATGTARNLLVSDRPLSRPFLSPDGRVLAFRVTRDARDDLIVAPLAPSGIKEDEWIVVSSEDDVRPAGWSPNSRLLYFVSARDGTRCLYAQRVSPSGALEGGVLSVKHFHGTRNVWANSAGVLSTGPANAVRGGSFFYDLATFTSNIWTVSDKDRNDQQP